MSKSVYVRVVHDLELLRYVLRCAIERQLWFPTGINKVYRYFDWLIDDRLYSAILRSLEQTHCACMWFYMSDYLYSAFFSFFFSFFFFEYPPKWCTYSAGMAGASRNCSRLGTSPVYTIQPCSRSLHAKPHICKMYACLAVTCHLHFWQNDQDLLRATAVTRGVERIPK